MTIPRLDRFITLYACAPLARLHGGGSGARVPILTYHSISNNLFGHSHPFYQINTEPEIFSRQMRWLKSESYQSIHLADMLEGLSQGQDMTKRVVITFDDGYRDFYTDGIAILKQCGFAATIFLATGRIHKTPMRHEGVDYLTWSDVRELHAEGVKFGSHTVTHPDLRSLEPDQIEYELGYSKEVIEQELGEAVESFSYPFPFPEEDRDFTRFIGDTLENQGFTNGVSSIIGRARRRSNRFSLPRIPINSWDAPELLRAKLLGGYDWMHVPQLLKKFIFHNLTLIENAARVDSRGAGQF
jgi:peptidoglycan/xylan/chitin deacetylase (PgdA/CDA1 family)